MDTNTYTILEEKREELTKKLNRLQKKAEKYSIPFSVSFGEPYAITIKDRTEGIAIERKYEVFDLTIESETIRKDGYTVIAHLEHSDSGNIVNVFEGEMQSAWATCAPFCEHCNSNHNLKYTFMVKKGDEVKQVGKTCLQEYCGINPQVVGMINQFVDEIDEYTPEGYDFREPIPCVFDTTLVLALAIDVLAEQGYIRSDDPKGNKWEISKKIGMYHPSDASYKKAEEMEKKILSLSLDDAIDANLNNVQTRVKGYYCKPSDFGYFAYAPVALERYEKKMEEKKRREEAKNQMAQQSEYIGTVGERATFSVKEKTLLTTFETYYGITFLYRFIDENDNVLIWFASSPIDEDTVSKIKATVKDHSERDGVKQTILTRVKVLAS